MKVPSVIKMSKSDDIVLDSKRKLQLPLVLGTVFQHNYICCKISSSRMPFLF